ncbi:hypothetical protein MASR2M8_16060 [Opitutaceae bacterium]
MKRFLGLGVFLCLALFSFAQTAAPASGPTRTLYLVRHGQYDSLPNAGPDGPGLTPLGIAQAKLVATRLHGLPVTFTSLTASTMTRARETALFIGQSLPQLPLQTAPLLREATPRSFTLANEKPEEAAAAEAQFNEAFARYFVPAKDRDEHDILVCHGNIIRYFVTKALGVDTQSWLGMALTHCSLTVIQVAADGTFKVHAVGDSGHIPANLSSGLLPTSPVPRLTAPSEASQ